jgi:hypothetical protein
MGRQRAGAFAVFGLAVLCGCGPGGTPSIGGGGGALPSGGGTGGNTGGTGGTGGSLSPQTRSAVLSNIGQKMKSLAGQPNDSVDQQITDFMKTIPQLTNVKLRDGLISANFTDGRFLVIYDNLRYDPANNRSVPRRSGTRAAMGQPYAAPAEVFLALGTFLNQSSHGGPDAAPDVANYLRTGASYAVSQPDASVEALKHVNGDGVFYIHTHGGVIDLPPHTDPVITQGVTKSFALWTTTPRDENRENPLSAQSDRQLQDDLFFGRLGYAYEAQNDVLGVPSLEWHYCITPAFIQHYGWKFAPDSFVFINACSSASADAGELGQAIKDAGASVYAGWTDEVDNGIANNTARFLIDRLIGANQYKPPAQKLRPFIRSDVQPAMLAAGLGHSSVVVDGKPHVADLLLAVLDVPDQAEGGFGILAPTIRNLEVDEPDRLLTLNGSFGDRPKDHSEKVTLGGHDLAITSWALDKVVCSLPGEAGYVGDCVIHTYGHESNHVPLTEIHGRLTVEQDSDILDIIDDNGTIHRHTVATSLLNVDVYIRADVHWWRTHLTDDPKQSQPFAVWAAPWSVAHHTHSGTVRDDGAQVGTISGGGDLPLVYLANDHFVSGSPRYYFEGTLDPATGKLTAKFYFFMANGIVTIKGAAGPWVFTALQLKGGQSAVSTLAFPPNYLSTLDFSINQDFDWVGGIGGSITIPHEPTGNQTVQKLTWISTPATPGTVPPNHGEDTRAAHLARRARQR